MKIIDVISDLTSGFSVSQSALVPVCPSLPVSNAGSGQEVGRMCLGWLTQISQRDVLMMPCLTGKSQGKQNEGEVLVLMAFFFLSHQDACWGLRLWEVAQHLLTVDNNGLIPLFALLKSMALASLLNYHYLDSRLFLLSFYFLPSLQESGVTEQATNRCSSWLKSIYHTDKQKEIKKIFLIF